MAYGIVCNLGLADCPDPKLHVAKEAWFNQHMAVLLHGSKAVVSASAAWNELPYFAQGGIYFLIWHGRICYVGQAGEIGKRLLQHWDEGRPVERVAVILDPPSWAYTELEHAYIRAWDPPWNNESTRCGGLNQMPRLLQTAKALDSSMVMPWFTPSLTAPVPAFKQWELAVIGYRQKNGDHDGDYQEAG